MRIPRLLHLALAVAVACGFILPAGCAFRKNTGKRDTGTAPTDAAPAPQRVGTVAVVNDDLHFVLVDVGSLYFPTAGTALKCFSSGTETGILAVNPEKERPFIVADIIRGTPRVGDVVEQ
jgi:hypothetical protein